MADKALEKVGLTDPAAPEKFDNVKPLRKADMQRCAAAATMFRNFSLTSVYMSKHAGQQVPPVLEFWRGMKQGFEIAADTMECFAHIKKEKYVEEELVDDITKVIQPIIQALITARLDASNNLAKSPKLPQVRSDEAGK